MLNHQGVRGVHTCDRPGFIPCPCCLSVSFIVLRSSPVSPLFGFLANLVDPAFEEERGLEKDSPTSPNFCDLIKFCMAPADRCFSFYFIAPFCVFQDSTRRIGLTLTLPAPSGKHFVISEMHSVLESYNTENFQRILKSLALSKHNIIPSPTENRLLQLM